MAPLCALHAVAFVIDNPSVKGCRVRHTGDVGARSALPFVHSTIGCAERAVGIAGGTNRLWLLRHFGRGDSGCDNGRSNSGSDNYTQWFSGLNFVEMAL